MEKREERSTGPTTKNLFRMILATCLLGGITVWGISLGLYPLLGGWGCFLLGLLLYGLLMLGTAAYAYRRMKKIEDMKVWAQAGRPEALEQSKQELQPKYGAEQSKRLEETGGFRAMSVNAGQHILLRLLQRDMAAGAEMEQLLKQSGIQFPYAYYCVAVLKIDDYGLISEDYSDQDIGLFKFSMRNIAEELLGEHMNMKVCHTGNGMDYMTFILNLERQPSSGELAAIFGEAIQHEADFFGIGFSAGIGTAAEGICSVSESYNNALDAVEYRLFYGKQSVTEYESIRPQETMHMDYPYDMEQEILRQAIRFHNRVKTMEHLDQFAEGMRHISAEDANLYIHQLGVAVNRALRQTEGISVNHLYSMREFSHFMDALTTLKEKQQQIRATLDELFQMAAEGADRKKQGIVQRVEDYIAQNYQNPDITVEDIAMSAGLSSNYLRRIFRDQCGYSPMDYLVNYRIETAKELFRDTTHTAKEVAELVGYANTKYFYSLFKKQTGQSTYEYKQSLEQCNQGMKALEQEE